jgi:endoglucanase
VLTILKTELGGGNTNGCLTYMCSVVAYLNANSDGMDNLLVREKCDLLTFTLVYLGYIGWGAGICKLAQHHPLVRALT